MMNTRRILIVEDVEMIANFMELVLYRHGYLVTGIATSGEEAISAAQACPPDLVLMDIKLQGCVDGIEAAEIIRSSSDIPIVFVSAYTEPDMIKKALATGASGYIIKPFRGNDLISVLKRILGREEAESPSGVPDRIRHPSVIYPA
jgi:CheY-like chemotaxis protein